MIGFRVSGAALSITAAFSVYYSRASNWTEPTRGLYFDFVPTPVLGLEGLAVYVLGL